MSFQAHLSFVILVFGLKIVVYSLNRMPTKILNSISPFEALFQK